METTTSGFKYEIDRDYINDWEMLELLNEIESGNQLKIVEFAKKLLGLEQYNLLKEHCRNEKGHVDAVMMNLHVREIMRGEQVKK